MFQLEGLDLYSHTNQGNPGSTITNVTDKWSITLATTKITPNISKVLQSVWWSLDIWPVFRFPGWPRHLASGSTMRSLPSGLSWEDAMASGRTFHRNSLMSPNVYSNSNGMALVTRHSLGVLFFMCLLQHLASCWSHNCFKACHFFFWPKASCDSLSPSMFGWLAAGPSGAPKRLLRSPRVGSSPHLVACCHPLERLLQTEMTHWSVGQNANGAMEQSGMEIYNPIRPAKDRGGGASSAFCLCTFGAATGFEVWHVTGSTKFW